MVRALTQIVRGMGLSPTWSHTFPGIPDAGQLELKTKDTTDTDEHHQSLPMFLSPAIRIYQKCQICLSVPQTAHLFFFPLKHISC